jgi:hypothetical protein
MLGLLGSLLETGGSANDKGYFATPTALNTAYPTGAAGWFAVVGSTDTIWIWDTGTSAWVNSGASGTGDVVGPSSATANALARYDLTTGKLIKDSSIIVDDSGNVTGINNLSLSGNQTFSGTAKRLFADFSNTTRLNRFLLQSSTLNSNTNVGAIPNGTAGLAAFTTYGRIDADNSEFLQIHADSVNSHVGLNSSKSGIRSAYDLVFQIDGATKAKINASDGKFNVATLTASQLVATDASLNLQTLPVATYPSLSELSFIKGLSSAVQTQLNTKLSAAITSLGGLTGAAQTFATASVGTDFAITSSGTSHTFSIPDAGLTARGLLNPASIQTIGGSKIFPYKTTATNTESSIIIGDNIAAATSTGRSKLTIGNTSGVSELLVGQSATNNILFSWNYNATPANAYGVLETYGGSNNLVIQSGAGNVGIGTPTIGSKLQINGGVAIGYNASTGSPTNGLAVAGGVTIGTATNNVSSLVASGYSLTAANAQSLVDLSGTWNTTGNPTALKLNITNTASGASSNLLDLQVGSTSLFKVDKTGIATAASYNITGTNTYSLQNGTDPAGTANALLLKTAGSTVLSVDSGGNVCITGSNAFLAVSDRTGGFANRMGFYSQSNTGYLHSVSMGKSLLSFGTTNGRLTLGISSPGYNGNATSAKVTILAEGNTSSTTALSILNSGSLSILALRDDGVLFPFQATTALAPTYLKGGMYFDTTLNKLRIGGATAWETVTSV